MKRPETKKSAVWRNLCLAAALLLCAAVMAALVLTGVVRLNSPGSGYPVRGIDVSSYQGEIDWAVIGQSGVEFAYIKATEGSSLDDPCFAANLSGVMENGIRAGAYHFFSFETPGKRQAEHFVSVVGHPEGMLPPAADVEYYGDFDSRKRIDPEAVRRELRDYVDAMEAEYGTKPVIYATVRSYRDIVRGYFDDCPLWIRGVYTRPSKSVDFTFWQYSDRGRFAGIRGREKYVDLNVFAGTPEEFRAFGTE